MRILLFSLVTAVALAMGMGLMGATPALAEENNSTETDVEVEFGDDLRITEYELEDGEARITFDADRSQTVTVSDALAGVDQDGATVPPSEDYDLEPGESTISMDVREISGGSTVGVSTGDGEARLSSSFEAEDPHDPLQYFGGISGLFTGIFMSVGLFGGAAWYVVRREDSGVIEA